MCMNTFNVGDTVRCEYHLTPTAATPTSLVCIHIGVIVRYSARWFTVKLISMESHSDSVLHKTIVEDLAIRLESGVQMDYYETEVSLLSPIELLLLEVKSL